MNNILKNSSKFLTVLILGLSLFLNVSGLAVSLPFVADDQNDVVVSTECDLAVRFKKEGNELTWTYGEGGGGVPGIYVDDTNYQATFGISCVDLQYEGAWEDFVTDNDYYYYVDGNVDDLTNFTQDSKNAIEAIKIRYSKVDNNPISYIFKYQNILYIYDLPDVHITHGIPDLHIQRIPDHSFDVLQAQFNSLAPSNASITYCFLDVRYNDDFNTYICNLKNDNVIGGYPDGTYKPNNLVNRGAMAKFMINGSGMPINTNCPQFSDIPADYEFANMIRTLKCNGVISGYPDGKYKPNNNVDRGAMAKFIKNGFNIPTNTTCGDFLDVKPTHGFYTEITSLKCANVISGYPDGTYKPNNLVNRGAMAKFIDNARSLVSI